MGTVTIPKLMIPDAIARAAMRSSWALKPLEHIISAPARRAALCYVWPDGPSLARRVPQQPPIPAPARRAALCYVWPDGQRLARRVPEQARPEPNAGAVRRGGSARPPPGESPFRGAGARGAAPALGFAAGGRRRPGELG